MKSIIKYFILVSIFIAVFINTLLAQTDTSNLKVLRKADYDLLSNNDLFAGIDFYVSKTDTFYRQLRDDETEATNGILVIINNIRYEYIILPKYTIGRYSSTSGYDELEISFDPQHPDRTLKFQLVNTILNDGKHIDGFFLIPDKENNIYYGDELYQIIASPHSHITFLLYKNTGNSTQKTIVNTIKGYQQR